MPRACAIIPALDAEPSIARLVRELLQAAAEERPLAVIVVDDGSSDATSSVARAAGAEVIRHATNRGKGAALLSGLDRARELDCDVAVTLDADGQHPPAEALRLMNDPAPAATLLLGVRDLARAGAPRANRISNGISNFFLSLFAARRLHDTQCGLRRYPVAQTLELGTGGRGYDFEAEVLLRARRAGVGIEERPIRVVYPPPDGAVSHFHVVRDPARIVRRVVVTLLERRR